MGMVSKVLSSSISSMASVTCNLAGAMLVVACGGVNVALSSTDREEQATSHMVDNTVNIYTNRERDLIQPLMDMFYQETGIKVNMLFSKSSGLIERLRLEGVSSPADILLLTNAHGLISAVKNYVARPLGTSESIYDNLTRNVQDSLLDPDKHYIPLSMRARVIYASRDRVKSDEITTYEDLASSKWKGRICTRKGKHPYNLGLFASMLIHNGDEYTTEWINGMKANLARTPQGNDRAQVKAIWSGECDISLGNTYYMGVMQNDPTQKEWASSAYIVFPKFKNGGTYVDISGAVVTRYSKRIDNAIALLEFMLSPEAQQLYTEVNFEYPVTRGVQVSDQVSEWGELKPDQALFSDIALSRIKALDIVEGSGFDEFIPE